MHMVLHTERNCMKGKGKGDTAYEVQRVRPVEILMAPITVAPWIPVVGYNRRSRPII